MADRGGHRDRSSSIDRKPGSNNRRSGAHSGAGGGKFDAMKMQFVVAVALLVVPACSKEDQQDGMISEGCNHSIPASGSKQKISHPKTPSSCMFVVMKCNYCAYDEAGEFSYSGSDYCGVCLSVSTH